VGGGVEGVGSTRAEKGEVAYPDWERC